MSEPTSGSFQLKKESKLMAQACWKIDESCFLLMVFETFQNTYPSTNRRGGGGLRWCGKSYCFDTRLAIRYFCVSNNTFNRLRQKKAISHKIPLMLWGVKHFILIKPALTCSSEKVTPPSRIRRGFSDTRCSHAPSILDCEKSVTAMKIPQTV